MFIFGLLVSAALWLALTAVYSLRLSPSGISVNELERRVKTGDKKAKFLRRRDKALPDLRAMRFASQVLLQVLFVAIGLMLLGYIFLPLIILALLFVGAGVKFDIISRKAQHFYEKHENELITFAERWRHVLKHARQEDTSAPPALGHSKEELLEKLATMRGILSKEELALIKNGLELSEKTVKSIMAPLDAIDALDREDALGPVTLDQLHNSGHTRFPVYNHDLNHVVGMLYLQDVANVQHGHHYVRDAMHSGVAYVRSDYSLERALAVFLQTRQSLLIVINHSEKTVGLLGLEDVIEALLGRNIANEFEHYEGAKAVAHAKTEKD